MTEDDDRYDSEDSSFTPALKKKSLGELSEKFSATLTEPGEAKAGMSIEIFGEPGVSSKRNSPSPGRRKSPSPKLI